MVANRAVFVLFALLGLLAPASTTRAGPPGDAILADGFERLGIVPIGDRALLAGESLFLQARASPAILPPVLAFSLPQAPTGAAIDAGTGVVTWSPDANQRGNAAFTVRVTDQAGATAQTSFIVAVLDGNNRPRMTPVPDQRIRVGGTLALALAATDPDPGDTLAFVRLSGPSALSLAAGGALAWTPSADDVGRVPVRAGVVDSHGDSDVTTFVVTVERANSPPVVAPLADRVAVVGRPLAFTAVALDPDVGDVVDFSLALAPQGATIDVASGAFAFTPTVAQLGEHRVRVVATDSLDDSASVELDIEVVDATAPVAIDDEYAVVEGESLVVSPSGVLANDTAPGTPTLAATLVDGPALGLLALQAGGGFTYTPSANRQKAAKGNTTLLSIDFESGIPSSVAPGTASLTGVQGYAGLGQPGNQFAGSFLRGGANVPVTVTLVNLPPHTALDIGVLLATIDSWDGSGTFPAGDNFEITLDGERVFFESFANAIPSQVQTYQPPPGVTLARRADLAFLNGGFFTDSAYDLGADPLFAGIPHTASTATITFRMVTENDQGLADESWAIDNLRVSIAVPGDRVALDSFTYTAGDGAATSAPATVRIEIREPGFAPRIVTSPPLRAANGLAYRYDAVAASAQPNDTIAWTLDQAPSGAAVDPAGVVTWTPTPAQLGTHRFQLRATDPRSASGTQVFVVAVTAPIAVPNVVNQPQAAATNAIAAADLVVGTVRSVPSANVPAGAVAAQSPPAGTQVVRATPVVLDVSTGPAPLPMPSVIGLTRERAAAVLALAGFPVGTVAFATDASLPPGTVTTQSPAAATYTQPGTSVALTVVSGPPLRFALPRELLSAGASLPLAAEALDGNGAPTQPQPTLAFGVVAEPGLAAGEPATTVGNVLQTGATTRGRWRVRATRVDTSEFAEALVTVVAPVPAAPPFEAHERLAQLVAALPDAYRRLQDALAANDTVALAALRTELAARATALRMDLPLLRIAPVTSPEQGFFPALAALPAAGFPETADDRRWVAAIDASVALVAASTAQLDAIEAGSSTTALDDLRVLDASLQVSVQRLATLAPTPYSAVAANNAVTGLLCAQLPRLVLAELDAIVRLLDAGVGARRGAVASPSGFGFGLAGMAAAASLRNDLVDRLTGSAKDHLVNAGIIMAAADLLRRFAGSTEGMDVITGASQSIHVFRLPGSSLDGSFNPIAEMNEVLMIGPDAVQAVRDLLGVLNLEGTDNARDLMDKFQSVADSANGVVGAFEEANSTPDRASSGCLLTDADCVSLGWDQGFASVNEGGDLHLPGPVIILVRDVADGRVHFATAGFLGQPDPDSD